MNDEYYMGLCIEMARVALADGKRPFGALVVVSDGLIIGHGDGTGDELDPTSHSEIKAIQEAAALTGGYLYECTLYSTHEPCIMCCGAINHAKIGRVVWGSHRDDFPHLYRRRNISATALLHDTSHPPELVAGVMRNRCVELWRGLEKVDV